MAGMVMRAQALLEHKQNPSDAEIIEQMETNLCRCGTHMRIIAAVKRAALIMQKNRPSIQSDNQKQQGDTVQ
ncbi:2Fe-2S iron-sulfur cluster-binding protein [Acidocella sp.]|uniref:2Fe-2S iron-sulfur cluster-binding protein n=1 Tax=Acidocella sp. TaxID=50710 RepID=UPI002F4282D8